MLRTFQRLESEVRGYSRSFPTIFTQAKGARLWDEQGREYIDFLSGAGTLNYGHNNPVLKKALIAYMEQDGLVHGLDMASKAKEEFLRTFDELILQPRGLQYKIQFPGPTGTNAVEAALKLARKVTKRTNVVSFTNGFHGVTLGAVAATANAHFRNAAGISLNHTTFMPYDGYMGDETDTLEYFRRVLKDKSSGVDLPAAVIVETVQGEGGVNVASPEWLRKLQGLCREYGIALIVDDIQAGCGRTGTFFSFEQAGIVPDMVTLSKSIGGYGLPMAIVLIKPSLDQWNPGEHNGTFRGNNLAFVAATQALKHYWANAEFSESIRHKAKVVRDRLKAISKRYPKDVSVRGWGLMQGLDCSVARHAGEISRAAFDRGLVIETSGAEGQVVKLLPPLVIEEDVLGKGLDLLEESVEAVLADEAVAKAEVGALNGSPETLETIKG